MANLTDYTYEVRPALSKIPDNAGYTHDSTDYLISKTPEFNPEDIVFSLSTNDDKEKKGIEYTPDLDYDALYVKTKVNYSDGTNSGWSRITLLDGDEEGIKFSNAIVATPELKMVNNTVYSVNLEDEVKVETNKFQMYSGNGEHGYSIWELYDCNNELLWKRDKDKTNRTSIVIPNKVLKENNSYVLKCKHVSDSGIKSKYGKLVFSTLAESNMNFILDNGFTLYGESINYIPVVFVTEGFSHFEVTIRDKDSNKLVKELSNLDSRRYIEVDLRTLTPGQLVYVDVKMVLNSGDSTVRRYERELLSYNVYPIATNRKAYNDNYTFIGEVNTGGTGRVVTRELRDGRFLTYKNKSHTDETETNKLVLDIIEDEHLYTIRKLDVELTDALTTPHIFTMHLESNNVLINYDTTDDTSKVNLYKYNSVTKDLSLIKSTELTGVENGMMYTGSVVNLDKDIIAFVPGRMDNKEDLKLWVMHTNTGSVQLYNLPFDVTENVFISQLDNNELIIGGGMKNTYDDDGNKTSSVRNNTVYSLNKYKLLNAFINNSSFDNYNRLADLPDTLNSKISDLMAVLRPDGKVVLFNNTVEKIKDDDTGDLIRGMQNTLVYDFKNNEWFQIANDWSDHEAYPITYIRRNGFMYRISGRVQDPQYMYGYINAEQSTEKEGVAIIDDLVVGAGETVSLEGPAVFNSITVDDDGELIIEDN